MSKSMDLRLPAVLYHLDGHTYAETAKIFHVSVFAVHAWVQKYQETGDLSDKPLNRGFKKNRPRKTADTRERPSGRNATGNRR
ncbi:MAG: helix-turn-helix domain-containing protein [Oscillibacter sp.]|nr:helix-turn-helix domain-containing protein [Oscillibacter sp.]